MSAMRGYARDEYENWDEYEEDGEEQEDEEGNEEEYEEEEVRQPTQEELEYLELRKRLKDSIRKQMKKELGTASTGSRDKLDVLRKDNYGSFFGPSQPVIAHRVIQESKSLLENPNLAARMAKSNHSAPKNSASSGPVGSKPRAEAPKAINGVKKKVEMLKNTRDYSFLLSEDAEIPSSNKSPPINSSASKFEARSSQQALPRSKHVVNSRGRDDTSNRDGRSRTPAGSQSKPRVGLEKMAPASKLSMESRKQLGSNNASGPGRPMAPKGVPSKNPAPGIGQKVTHPVAKNSIAGGRKPMLSQQADMRRPAASQKADMRKPAPSQKAEMRRPALSQQADMRRPAPSHLQSGVQRPKSSHLQSSLSKTTSLQRKEYQETSKPKVMPQRSLQPSRDEVKRPPPKVAGRGMPANQHSKGKPGKRPFDSDEEDDPINMIRNMFGYDRNKFRDYDDDDSDMEANFDEIQREEKRSLRIARQEDEEQARLIEEEERRERMRLAKKRKMGH